MSREHVRRERLIDSLTSILTTTGFRGEFLQRAIRESLEDEEVLSLDQRKAGFGGDLARLLCENGVFDEGALALCCSRCGDPVGRQRRLLQTLLVSPGNAGQRSSGGPTGIRTQNQRIQVCAAFAAPWTMSSPALARWGDGG